MKVPGVAFQNEDFFLLDFSPEIRQFLSSNYWMKCKLVLSLSIWVVDTS